MGYRFPAASSYLAYPFFSIVLALLALLAIQNLSSTSFKTTILGKDTVQQLCHHNNEVVKEQQTPNPLLSTTAYTFQQIEALEDLSHANDHRWKQTALPQKGGFLWVKYNETSNEAWGVSMFHALHCLKMLRMAVQESPFVKAALQDHDVPDAEKHHHHDGSANHPDMDIVHLGHCIGYIAQHLFYSADSTIEPPWLRFNDQGQVIDAGVDGEGYQHQCRDANPLWKMVAQSEARPVEPWGWKMHDTVESVFGARIL